MLVRLSLAAAAFAVGALLIASGASADKPVKEAGTADPFVFDGDTSVCDFPVQVMFTAYKAFSTTHLAKDGELRWIGGAGRIVQRLTNLDNNKSVTLDSSGPGKITFDETGITIDGTGAWIIGYYRNDTPSHALLLYKGHIVLHGAPNGTLTLVSYVGSPPKDICAMIAR